MSAPAAAVQRLDPGALVELFELDATALGGELYRWHNGTNALGNDVVWAGQVYSRLPVQVEGFAKSGQGASPRPTLSVANVTGLMGALARSAGDLLGAVLTRRRMFARYLDAVNFPGGVNPEADPLCEFSPEIWLVDRKVAENGVYVQFELASALDVGHVKLPRRACVRSVCTWVYRGDGCGYTGGPVAQPNDTPTTDPQLDRCGKRLSSCQLRFGVLGALPFGGFPGVGVGQ